MFSPLPRPRNPNSPGVPCPAVLSIFAWSCPHCLESCDSVVKNSILTSLFRVIQNRSGFSVDNSYNSHQSTAHVTFRFKMGDIDTDPIIHPRKPGVPLPGEKALGQQSASFLPQGIKRPRSSSPHEESVGHRSPAKKAEIFLGDPHTPSIEDDTGSESWMADWTSKFSNPRSGEFRSHTIDSSKSHNSRWDETGLTSEQNRFPRLSMMSMLVWR